MFLRINGVQSGPFAAEEISRRYLSGELDSRVMSWCGGEDRWTSLAKRWPPSQLKMSRVLGVGVAIVAIGTAATTPLTLIDMLPFSLQTGPMLWCLVVGPVLIAVLGLYGSGHGSRQSKVSLPLVVLNIAVVAVGVVALALAGFVYPVLQVRQQAPNAVVSFDPSLNALRIKGAIGPHLPTDFHDLLKRYPGARGLVLNSEGGLVTDALAVANDVRAHGLAARVDGICASACVAIWAASPQHQMTVTSRLGLHQVRLDLDEPPDIVGMAKGKLKEQYDSLLRGAGFNEQTIEKKNRTPPTNIYWLDPTQVVNAGVAVDIFDANGAQVSNRMAKWLWVESVLGNGNPMSHLMLVIRQHATPLVNKHADALYQAFQKNDANAARAASQSLSADAKQFSLAHASDEAILTWARSSQAMINSAIAARDEATCAFLSGNRPAGQTDPDKTMALASSVVSSLSQMVETLDSRHMELPPSVSDRRIEREVAQLAWDAAMRQGFPAQAERWNGLQRCGYMADYYNKVIRLAPHEAAQVVRIAEGSK